MMMQAVHNGKQSQAPLHTRANHSVPVPTGAATRGELLGSSDKDASGAPAQPTTGTRHRLRRERSPVPVLQPSAHAAQVWATVCLLTFQLVLALHTLRARSSLTRSHLWAACVLLTSCSVSFLHVRENKSLAFVEILANCTLYPDSSIQPSYS